MNAASDPAHDASSLYAVRRLLEGIIPPSICTVSADGMPHVSMLSHAEYVDEQHIALSYQFFNRSRANLLATGRAALMIEDPVSGGGVVLQLHYLRTETEGPIFERVRIKLAGIAAQTGMEKVFHLRGADIHRVESLRKIEPLRALPAIAPRCDLAAGVRRLSGRLAEAPDLAALLQAFTTGLVDELKIDHAIVWMLDEAQQNLYTLASIGYAQAGTGAELPLADTGLVGVALRENVPIRIGHMSTMVGYGLSWRVKVEQLGLHAVMEDSIALPGLAQPRSQMAVPLRARGRSVGVLLVESDHDQFFSYDDEDALSALGAQLAQGLLALRGAELPDAIGTTPSMSPGASSPVASTPGASSPVASSPGASSPVPPSRAGSAVTLPLTMSATANAKVRSPALRIRHYPRDHSVFVDDQYLIKGVAGAIVAKLVRDRIATGRETFSTRELRLAGGDLRLPEVQDNLGVRLLLLERRLSERDFGLRIERCGRGQYRLVANGPLALEVGPPPSAQRGADA